jgi:probable addiction module antidote protein
MAKVKTKTYKWDASKYLKDEKDITVYLNLVFEEDGDDPEFIAKAFRTVAKARGMSKLARQIGMSRSAAMIHCICATGKAVGVNSNCAIRPTITGGPTNVSIFA